MANNKSIRIPTIDDRIEIKVRQADGRRKENEFIRGIIIEEYKEHILLLNEKTKVRESFMKNDFKYSQVDFRYIS